MQPSGVAREPAWIRGDSVACFGWRHSAPGVAAAGCVAVICGPVGHEYTRAHRSLRHLADRLARAGIPALRFDYHGTGDSPGDDLDPGRLAAWTASVRSAVAHARAWSGCERVALVGVRLGAALAAQVAAEEPVDRLVLWTPVVRGKAWIRELQAIAMAAESGPAPPEGALESAGFVYTPETLAQVKALDLLALKPLATRHALVLGRDDIALDDALPRHLAACGVACDSEAAPGWTAMMADHQFSVVPDAALDRIVAWLRAREAEEKPVSGTTCHPAAAAGSEESSLAPLSGPVEEVLCRFGPDGSLFGVLARSDVSREPPVVLMFNGGSVHHVGPNRLYVTLARQLAAKGVPSLRFDMEGIGDSVLRGEGRENHPYRGNGIEDAREAMAHLREEFGYSRFIALGLCSGAHNAFHTRLALADAPIAELVLINPVTFHWVEGMSLEGATRAYDALAYRKSMKDPSRWLKLLRGDVNFGRLFAVALSWPAGAARKGYDALCETFVPRFGPPLARDLGRLEGLGCPLTLVVSEGDPGRDLLMSGAPRTAKRAIRAGRVRVETIAGADHTFTQWQGRDELVARLVAHLVPSGAPVAVGYGGRGRTAAPARLSESSPAP